MVNAVGYLNLGRMAYGECLELQRRIFDGMVAAKSQGRASGDKVGTILTVEHPAVYTLGKNGRESNLLVDLGRLSASGAEFYRTDRGGDITFHGEGQIVGYPILDLERIGTGLRDYVDALEQAVIDTLADYGIAAGRSAGASGVWLGGDEKNGPLRKICAIGVRASRYITMHGFALNVNTDLQRFEYINPCGFADRGVTSMQRELGFAPDIDEVREKTVRNLAARLSLTIVPAAWQSVEDASAAKY